jgi:hypothetical protein
LPIEPDTLFPDLEPVPVVDPLAGLGQDARRTLRQAELIAAGVNPGTRLPLHEKAAHGRDGDGLRCRDCTSFYRAAAGNHSFNKCEQNGPRHDRGNWGPDVRGWWPACRAFEPGEGAPCP